MRFFMKKRFVIGILMIIIIISSIILLFVNKKEVETETKVDNSNKIIETIAKHYNKYVITNKEAILYKKDNNKYIEYGKINKGLSLELEDIKVTEKIKYFKIKGLDLYISYQDVEKTEEFTNNDRHKNYIPFNTNVVTKNLTTFYDENDFWLYTVNQSFDFKVIVKDDNRYGIEYNDKLLYIRQDDIEKTYDNDNKSSNKTKIKTLTYHFLYNQTNSSCNQSICQSFEQFESHLKYIRENNYFTLKLNELEMYLDGKINIPEKSIVLTIDDGTIFDTDAIKLLEQYEVNATLFLITKIADNFDYLKSTYLDLESHTNDMHNQYECPGYGSQGGGILCLPEDQVLQDLKTSQEKIGGSKYFAYPFFDFNNRAISLLKQAGFNMAFIGQYNTDGYAYPNKTNKYKVPRKTIFNTTTIEEFISYLE